MQEFDSPWKQISETLFAEMLAFYRGKVYEAVDWSRPVRCLDKELPKLFSEGQTGRREVDKLFEVHRKEGSRRLVYIHIEFQNQQDPDLPERIFTYYYRLFDKYRKPIWTLVLLGDSVRGWRPDCYESELWDLCLSLRYPIIKLTDYEPDLDELLQSREAFALVTAAHLLAQQTRKKPFDRLGQKLTLTKLLYQKGFSKDEVLTIFRFIDWVMQLPPALTQQFHQALAAFEGEKQMPYITSIERLGHERGWKEGREEGREEMKPDMVEALLTLLKQQNVVLSEQVLSVIEAADVTQVRTWLRTVINGEVPTAFSTPT
ncbi:hypothetical protein [Acanthopleuribacter pedis]|uniref:Transposase n=1 Tax=Acanthopleuribacter pedis TaxID=442870 RepID=A0A8J7U0B8_9BACT|nr:hypothetical protein [Acanthopleuribacter pedis]MBO1316908.1 hypothetical protein [Acanthopleuribacter pedis]